MPKFQYSSDSFAWSLVDTALLVFASCTFAYEFVLVARLPTWSWYPSVTIALTLAIILQFRYGELSWKKIRFDSQTLGLIVLGIACALINVFTLRPDADDFSYFHRAVFGLLDLSAPISIHNNAHDIKSLPALSPVFLTSSLEVVEALVAKAFGIQPIFFYQQIIGSLTLFIFAAVYFLVFRYLRFSQYASLLGVAIIIFLYAFSGDSHQDWGNFTVVRVWQGKCILITLLVPLTALLTFQFLRTGSSSDLLRLHFVALSGIGLSGTAFFLIPFIVGISILGAVPYQFKQTGFLHRILLLSSTLLFFVVILIVIKVDLLPDVSNTAVWQVLSNGNRRLELYVLEITVFVKKTTLVFYLISALGILWFYRRNSRIASLTISSLCVCVAIILPPVSSFLIKLTLPGAYWRLAYASQMLLIIGLFSLLCFYGIKRNQYFINLFRIAFGVCFTFGFGLLKTPAINFSVIHAPQALKFPQQDIAFANFFATQTPVGTVAAIPEELIPAVGLLRPDIGLISSRTGDTIHVFVNKGRENEGKLRVAAQRDLNSCGSSGQLKDFLSESSKLTVMVFPVNCEPQKIISNLSINEADWKITPFEQYQLWFKLSTNLTSVRDKPSPIMT